MQEQRVAVKARLQNGLTRREVRGDAAFRPYSLTTCYY